MTNLEGVNGQNTTRQGGGSTIDVKNGVNVYEALKRCEKVVELSRLMQETMQVLQGSRKHDITHIRCLALGSPCESTAALYQLAYLVRICNHLKILSSNVSLYDPVFTSHDKDLLEKVLQFEISEQVAFGNGHGGNGGENLLFFLPHATLELTNKILEQDEPKLLLGNNIMAHTDRLTQRKLHDSFPMVSLLKQAVTEKSVVTTRHDDFIEVSHKKKRNKRKLNLLVYKEPEIEYDYDGCYFNTVTLTPLENIGGCWGNAFSDLALHVILQQA